jgi:hypothetical protein
MKFHEFLIGYQTINIEPDKLVNKDEICVKSVASVASWYGLTRRKGTRLRILNGRVVPFWPDQRLERLAQGLGAELGDELIFLLPQICHPGLHAFAELRVIEIIALEKLRGNCDLSDVDDHSRKFS